MLGLLLLLMKHLRGAKRRLQKGAEGGERKGGKIQAKGGADYIHILS